MNEMEPQNLLAVGIDTASQRHHAVAVRFPETALLDEEVENTPAGFARLDERVQRLAQAHGLVPVYGIEGSGSYGRPLACFLVEKQRDVREIPPLKVNRQKAYYGQDKSDQIDARCAAAVVMRSLPELPRLTAPDPNLEAIRKTSRFLDRLVTEQTRNLNQLHAALLDTYQACATTLFENLGAKTALEFYRAFPSPRQLQGVSKTKLTNMLSRASRGKLGQGKDSAARRKAEHILASAARLAEAPPLPALELHEQIITCLCEQILASKQMIRKLTRTLKKDLLPRTGLKLETITGINTRSAGVILGETRDIRRFHSNSAYARYNGTAPRSHSTGNSLRHRARKDCNHRLKWIFHQVALVNSLHDPLGAAYYQACVARGLNHNQALKRLARRLSDLVYALMRDQSEYDPATARASMERRRTKKSKGEEARSRRRDQIPESLSSPEEKSSIGEAKC